MAWRASVSSNASSMLESTPPLSPLPPPFEALAFQGPAGFVRFSTASFSRFFFAFLRAAATDPPSFSKLAERSEERSEALKDSSSDMLIDIEKSESSMRARGFFLAFWAGAGVL
eukprot:CAMPEP_0182877164 /NCGR_PEP_ID=MMETSP0034_2-20130328/14588_1 /TAXON_ID=156128 /ORGANISM="Nephroselmis pyriformis, Strain CCMP717" /LENGTH=113 /DNA_ID=CAMNT_0025009991 /DNA_START=53 /DNA_END=391 /DNA_ORIENTATION=-